MINLILLISIYQLKGIIFEKIQQCVAIILILSNFLNKFSFLYIQSTIKGEIQCYSTQKAHSETHNALPLFESISVFCFSLLFFRFRFLDLPMLLYSYFLINLIREQSLVNINFLYISFYFLLLLNVSECFIIKFTNLNSRNFL